MSQFKNSLIYRRLFLTLGYSIDGLAFAWRTQEAFRVEVLMCALLAPLALVLEPTLNGRIWLLGSLMLVLIAELFNTAIEQTVNRISMDQHELSKAAKDLGSAAVGLTLLLALGIWLSRLWLLSF
jgi:diacylglycerol kinase (ATP)